MRTPIAVLGASSGPRVEAFRAALANLGRPPAEFISYDQFLQRPSVLKTLLRQGTILRFDSPDRDVASLSALYKSGADKASDAGYTPLSTDALDRAISVRGHIGSPSQLIFGLDEALKKAAAIGEECGARLLATPESIVTSFDKTVSTGRVHAHGIPTPPVIGRISSYEELIANMQARKLKRAFIKLRFGSSAAGMTALALGPHGQLAAYTTATLGENGELYASRALRRLTVHREVQTLIDRLAPLGLHAEGWVPKTGIEGRNADLRIIMIKGEPVFNIMRLSHHPMTNLHLGGIRLAPEILRRRAGEAVWGELLDNCRAVTRLYGDCFMLGIDAAILAGDRRHAILEVNAFGDHVNDVHYKELTPQQWQILQYDLRGER